MTRLTRRYKTMLFFFIFGTWLANEPFSQTPVVYYPSLEEVLPLAESQTLHQENKVSLQTPAMAQLGRKLFFDKRFSANQAVSCASCHQPELGFTDPYPTAHGIGVGGRRTPSLQLAAKQHWFFWDGRADSLEAQALGPIEHPLEHGFSRIGLVKEIATHYRGEFEAVFGNFPLSNEEIQKLPDHGMPAPSPLQMPANISTYALASLEDFWIQDRILSTSSKQNLSPGAYINQISDPRPQPPSAWAKAWSGLQTTDQIAINQVFGWFGRAIASYERRLELTDSLYDQGVRQLAQSPASPPLFNEEQIHGMKVFFGPGRCNLCHSGPDFSDHQFHNIGLPHSQAITANSIDIGRAMGIVLAKASDVKCDKPTGFHPDSTSCAELNWTDPANLEFVGAFKTPSLRNVTERQYYMHDGRFSTLEEVIDYYNQLEDKASLGHREETLIPLKLGDSDKKALIAFLKTLVSPIKDHTREQIAKHLVE